VDNALLLGELQSLEGLGFDLALTGFSLDEIRTLEDPTHGGRTGDDDATRVAAQRGQRNRRDLWRLGAHRLLCDDATSMARCAR